MYGIDVLTALIVSGLGCVFGSVVLGMVRSDVSTLADGLWLFRASLATFGIGLLTPLFCSTLLSEQGTGVTAATAIAGVTLWGAGMLRMAGQRAPRVPMLWLAAGTFAVTALCAGLLEARQFGLVLPAIGTLQCAVLTGLLVHRLRTLSGTAEIAYTTVLGAYSVSWIVRLGLALGWDGPLQPAYLQMSENWARAFALLYGGMPVAVAIITFVMVHTRMLRQMQLQATTDDLTGTLTRRGFRARAEELLAAPRHDRPLVGVAMIDVDHFKSINDGFGHTAGDEILVQLARLLRGMLGRDALLARYGGEEFAALIRVRSHSELSSIAETLRLRVASHTFSVGRGVTVKVTISVGASPRRDGEHLDITLDRADQLLYRAKTSGRNRVVNDMGVSVA